MPSFDFEMMENNFHSQSVSPPHRAPTYSKSHRRRFVTQRAVLLIALFSRSTRTVASSNPPKQLGMRQTL